jgi:hypothetical protein
LADARKELRLIIERPNVDRDFREPIFLVQPLKNAVRELGWGSYFLGPQMGYVSFQLDASITQLETQVKLSKVNHRHLERQLATAHLLKGAMHIADASASKKRSKDDRTMKSSALNHFQSALAVDQNDCEALEYASHVLVSPKQDHDADVLLNRLLQVTAKEQTSLSRSRAFRYKASIEAGRSKNGNARKQLKEALRVLANLSGVDRIEEAELHEDPADSQNAMRNRIQARSHWEIAGALYKQLPAAYGSAGASRISKKLSVLDQLPDKDRDADGAAA